MHAQAERLHLHLLGVAEIVNGTLLKRCPAHHCLVDELLRLPVFGSVVERRHRRMWAHAENRRRLARSDRERHASVEPQVPLPALVKPREGLAIAIRDSRLSEHSLEGLEGFVGHLPAAVAEGGAVAVESGSPLVGVGGAAAG